MAQLDGIRRCGETPKTPNTRTVEQLLHEDSSKWPATPSPTTSPTFGKDHDQEEYHAHHHKKSVLTKVKEKAKKLRHSLSKKKQNHDDNTTPLWGVSLDDDDEDEDPEYLGAPMYESELAPEGYKETARQHPRVVPATSEKHVLVSSADYNVEQEKEKPPCPSPSKTLTETVTEKLAPTYTTVSEATQTITSKIQGLALSAMTAPKTGEHVSSNEQIWDKGVSVKEYLMQKLEPGEDERALSQVISEVMSPKKTPGEMGVVEKVKEAVTSFLWTEESAPSTNITMAKSTSLHVPSSTNAHPMTKSTSSHIPSSKNTHPMTKSASVHIPISTNAHEVVEEENQGRILQAN